MPAGTPNRDPVAYNRNGAMKQNWHNGIAGISYNVLNLPEKIGFMNGHAIHYSYDAAGAKRKVVHYTAKINVAIPLGTTNYTPDQNDIMSELTTDK